MIITILDKFGKEHIKEVDLKDKYAIEEYCKMNGWQLLGINDKEVTI